MKTGRPSKHDRIGFEIWKGPSRFDRRPVVLIATGLGKRWKKGANDKTGDAVQTYVLRQDVHPTEARRNGADTSVCGDCPLCGNHGCYVRTTAPAVIWGTWRAGGYYRLDTLDPTHRALFEGRTIRVGSYGDPLATPLGAWRELLEWCEGWTGYTHGWRRPGTWRWRQYLMASCSSPQDRAEAKTRGFATFRILRPGEEREAGEAACPSARGVKCVDCRGCRGGSARDRTIALHGSVVMQRDYLRTIGEYDGE
jgi:hypothetical protein